MEWGWSRNPFPYFTTRLYLVAHGEVKLELVVDRTYRLHRPRIEESRPVEQVGFVLHAPRVKDFIHQCIVLADEHVNWRVIVWYMKCHLKCGSAAASAPTCASPPSCTPRTASMIDANWVRVRCVASAVSWVASQCSARRRLTITQRLRSVMVSSCQWCRVVSRGVAWCRVVLRGGKWWW